MWQAVTSKALLHLILPGATDGIWGSNPSTLFIRMTEFPQQSQTQRNEKVTANYWTFKNYS